MSTELARDQVAGNTLGTVADMVADSSLQVGDLVSTAGYYAAGDGAGATYLIDSSGGFGGVPDDLGDHLKSNGDVAVLQHTNGVINVKQYGAKGDDATNDSASFMAAHNAGTKETGLWIPKSNYRVNLSGWSREIQSDGAELRSHANSNATVLGLIGHRLNDNWDFAKITNIRINGRSDGGTTGIVGVSIGEDGDSANGGRWVFDTVSIQFCDKGFYKETGNIGNRFYNCSFAGNVYGVYAKSTGVPQHSFADSYFNCHFQTSTYAGLYYKGDTGGAGNLYLNNTIIEGNAGFGVFINYTGAQSLFVPITITDCWVEGNAGGAAIPIDGMSAQTPRDYRFDGVKTASIRNSYVYNIELNNSHLLLDNVRVDNNTGTLDIIKDADSYIHGENCVEQLNSSTENVYVNSVLSVNGFGGGLTNVASFRMPMRTAKIPKASTNYIGEAFHGSSGVGFLTNLGTVPTVAVTGGILGPKYHRLTITNAATTYAKWPGTALNPNATKITVGSLHFRVTSGSASITFGGGSGYIGVAKQDPDDPTMWTCAVGISENSTASGVSLYIVPTSFPCVIDMAEFMVADFVNTPSALNYINSGCYMAPVGV